LAEIYQQFVAGIRAIEDGGGMYLRPESEAEAVLYKRKLREMAKAEGLTIRFKDKVRRKRDKDTEQFVERHNFEFLVAKPTPKQEEGTSKLQKGQGK
jgi:hypothetical protein